MAGWANSPLGQLDALDLDRLIVGFSCEVLRHAGIEANEVDRIWLGRLNGRWPGDASGGPKAKGSVSGRDGSAVAREVSVQGRGR